ncbi:hypothetical protein KSS87_005364 [Heliosperma pusillum]|nr:hypothetical protein KSS87_005364 [Heliosperma pusillum]
MYGCCVICITHHRGQAHSPCKLSPQSIAMWTLRYLMTLGMLVGQRRDDIGIELYSMDMSTLSSDGVVLRSFLLETVASATLQSLTFIIALLESLPSAAIMLPQEPSSFNWLSIANSKKMEEPDSQCKDADGDEDDDDDDDDEAGGGEAGDVQLAQL